MYSNCKILGVASALPKNVRGVESLNLLLDHTQAQKVSDAVGVNTRYITDSDETTVDLCYDAAQMLFEYGGWEFSSVDTLIFISQTPDYVLPASSCVLHQRLSLSQNCRAFDINLGCSGYIYGLWLAANLLNSGGARRVLLLVGDTISKITNPLDRAVMPLFGDAGTATLIDSAKINDTWCFELGTNGQGYQHLIVPQGGFRQNTQNNIERTGRYLQMNGPEIFGFSVSTVPVLLKNLLTKANLSIETIDYFLFHQANKMILKHIQKKMDIPAGKLPMSLNDVGNTSSASIPLTMSLKRNLMGNHDAQQLMLVGFGVGYSWGGVTLKVYSDIVLPPVKNYSTIENAEE